MQGLQSGDRRPIAIGSPPNHAHTPEEHNLVPSVANEPRFADRAAARIVPALANRGIKIANEPTFARVLDAEGQDSHRGRATVTNQPRTETTQEAELATPETGRQLPQSLSAVKNRSASEPIRAIKKKVDRRIAY